MRAYVINLDSAQDRWAFMKRAFAETSFELCRVPAVDGMSLKFPVEDYSESLYHRFHGRPTNPRIVGCYFSHVRAMQAFLATEDSHALICEDDLTLHAGFEAAVDAALLHARHWNILRLSGLSRGQPYRVARLTGDYELNVNFARLKGLGAYIVDRAAARATVTRLLPMYLPIDHALDREWFYGLRAACILPFPVSQSDSGFRSSIQVGKSLKLSPLRRWMTTYPFQVFNELTRWLFRFSSFLTMKLAMD